MIKKIAYILIPACAATISVASAETIPSNPVLLTAGEMDQVTAGLASSVSTDAVASSDFLAFASTKAVTLAQIATDNPNLPAGSVAAGGIAVAGAVGQGSSKTTNITPSTDLVAGPGVQVFTVNVHRTSQIVDISGGAVVGVVTPYFPL